MPSGVERGILGSVRAVALGLMLLSCSVDDIDLSGKSCPCASGWRCDDLNNVCVKDSAAGGASGSGGTATGGVSGSGAVGSGGSSATGGTAGAGGVGATGGVGGTGGSGCPTGKVDCNGSAADGCEVEIATDAQHCGTCGNDCTTQGDGTGFVCGSSVCKCSEGAHCDATLSVGTSCAASTGLCSCDGAECSRGESCRKAGGKFACSCNGGAACAAGETCCPSGGCVDLTKNKNHCGACGIVCATTLCAAGKCG